MLNVTTTTRVNAKPCMTLEICDYRSECMNICSLYFKHFLTWFIFNKIQERTFLAFMKSAGFWGEIWIKTKFMWQLLLYTSTPNFVTIHHVIMKLKLLDGLACPPHQMIGCS